MTRSTGSPTAVNRRARAPGCPRRTWIWSSTGTVVASRAALQSNRNQRVSPVRGFLRRPGKDPADTREDPRSRGRIARPPKVSTRQEHLQFVCSTMRKLQRRSNDETRVRPVASMARHRPSKKVAIQSPKRLPGSRNGRASVPFSRIPPPKASQQCSTGVGLKPSR